MGMDAVGLHAKTMSHCHLPCDEYSWVEGEEECESLRLNIMDVDDDADYGYLVRCDLEYPMDDDHAEWPLLCQRVLIGGVYKLCGTLMNKSKYVCHWVVLKQAIRKGLVLTKIHCAIKFRQSDWLLPYIKKDILLLNFMCES